jgi:nucleotide-binding universal stress UspA family protein
MQEMKKWMVGLDLTEFDDHLIGYTHYLSRFFDPEEIVFVHVKKSVEIPSRFRKVEEKSREDIKEEMEKKVFALFDPKLSPVKCEVHAGNPSFELWRETYLHHTDLFIVGEKKQEYGRRITPEKFIKKSFCSVLFVPIEASDIKSVWVPVDLSENSRDAVEVASHFNELHDGGKLYCHYVFETPNLNLIKEELHQEYIDFYREESEKGMKSFLEGFDIPNLETVYTQWTKEDVANHIQEEAESHDADIIVMTSRGHSGITNLLLGSTSNELITLEKKLPLLILKKRIDKVRAWDVLTNLI